MVQEGDGQTAGMKVVALGEGDQFLRHRAQGLGLAEGGFDPAVLDQAARQVGEQGLAVRGVAFEFCGFATMSHRVLPVLKVVVG